MKAQKYTIATIGSHSALEICRGAKDEGFKTLVIVEKGRDKTYAKYFKSIVDDLLYVEKFKDVISANIQKKLNAKNCIFVPHRSFEVYVNDYEAIEKDFKVPMFGNRKLLRFEERDQKPNQYDLLEKADIKYPKIFKDPKTIDRLVIVKVPEKERRFERAFFLCNSSKEFQKISQKLINNQKITKEVLNTAIIEEFILGVQVNFNFFYSSILGQLELIGTDTRRQTSLDGYLRLPADVQSQIGFSPKYEEASHVAVTVLESMLEGAFEIGEKFVKTTQSEIDPGIIGPFALQAAITPGPPKKEIVVFDVSLRMPGSPGIASTPYTYYLYGQSISMGRRVAMEIKASIKHNKLEKILT